MVPDCRSGPPSRNWRHGGRCAAQVNSSGTVQSDYRSEHRRLSRLVGVTSVGNRRRVFVEFQAWL